MNKDLEISHLKVLIRDLHRMARRYADNRTSYITSDFNYITRDLIKLGVELDCSDGIIWARDNGGRFYDKLSNEEAIPGTQQAKGKI